MGGLTIVFSYQLAKKKTLSTVSGINSYTVRQFTSSMHKPTALPSQVDRYRLGDVSILDATALNFLSWEPKGTPPMPLSARNSRDY